MANVEVVDLKKLMQELATVGFCAVAPLGLIQKKLKGQYHIAAQEGAGKFLLISGRKDVIEWALAHRHDLELDKISPAHVLKYQTFPRLRNLIFKTMGWKYEDLE